MLLLKNGAPAIQTIGDRRYAICDEPIHYSDGTPVDRHADAGHCGQLIDITDERGIRVTDRCNCDHSFNGSVNPLAGRLARR